MEKIKIDLDMETYYAKKLGITEIPNFHQCNTKLWNKFSTQAKEVFNGVYEQSINNQILTVHPNTNIMVETEWKTISYNFSVYAAWAIDKKPIKKNDVVEDINKKGKTVKKYIVK